MRKRNKLLSKTSPIKLGKQNPGSILKSKALPKHLVFMLDGNRRWAIKRGLLPYKGHEQGAKTLEKIINSISAQNLELDIPYLTFWGSSVNNLVKRPEKEVKVLFNIYERYFAKLGKKKELYQKGVRVRILGSWQKFMPEKVKKTFFDLIEKTKNHRNYNLTFLIAYDGKEEMENAISLIANRRSRDKNLKITGGLIKENLWTGELPDVDLVIRTGVENDPHWSAGFMMWHCADSLLYFTKTLWPDFTIEEFEKALKIYKRTQRRFGK
jgi:undecaprenyl diphosphate synthase